MIKEINLNNIATYTTPITMRPLDINFCYGSNGSGKTTLSNIVGKYEQSDNCSISWDDSNELPVLVYNKRFVEVSFGESSKLGGIFTLGKDTKEAQEFIAEQREEVKKCTTSIETFTKTKEKLEVEQNILTSNLEDICWAIQQTHGEKFKDALAGFRGSKKVFATKCIVEYPTMDEKNPPILKDIEELYGAAYGDMKTEYKTYPEIPLSVLPSKESCPLLGQRISGSSETPVGKFIEYLNNSDWVKQGMNYAVKADNKCPYCQQPLPKNIQSNIEVFFDEAYESDCTAVRTFQTQYIDYSNALLSQLKNIFENPIPILKYDLFKSEWEVLSASIDASRKTITEKVTSPAIVVSIDSIEPILLRINEIIKGYNAEIKTNSNIVNNQSRERQNCQTLVWNYFTYELRKTLQQYQDNLKSKSAGISSLTSRINDQKEKQRGHKQLIVEKEQILTSVMPTVNAINRILKRFGFAGFEIAENPDEKGTYKIIRPDGSNAKKTLSEGEYNFITFLYFYHLVYGSQYKTGIASDKVVVIDDPISSLDSNVLFIISTLIRTMLTDCKDQKNGIKQIFVLTHNVYFHKEVTYIGSRDKYPTTRTAYWVIKKKNNVTGIDQHKDNPIQTSYELLWAELKDVTGQQHATIFNTLRRILEYYFNIIGGLEYEKCIDRFEGEDKIICKALISCINDGSHFISDDFVMCFESNTMDNLDWLY